MEGWVFLLVLMIPMILLVPGLAERLGRSLGDRDPTRGESGAPAGNLAPACPNCGRPLTSVRSVCSHCRYAMAVQAQPAPDGALVDRPWIPLLVTLLFPILLFLLSAVVLVFLLGGMPGVGGTGG